MGRVVSQASTPGVLGKKRRSTERDHPEGTQPTQGQGHSERLGRTAAGQAGEDVIPLAAEILLKRIWAGLSRSW